MCDRAHSGKKKKKSGWKKRWFVLRGSMLSYYKDSGAMLKGWVPRPGAAPHRPLAAASLLARPRTMNQGRADVEGRARARARVMAPVCVR